MLPNTLIQYAISILSPGKYVLLDEAQITDRKLQKNISKRVHRVAKKMNRNVSARWSHIGFLMIGEK